MQSAALTAPTTGAFRKAREAMQGDAQIRLKGLLSEFQKLREQLAAIQTKQEKFARRWADDTEAAREKFEASKSREDERQYWHARMLEDFVKKQSHDPIAQARLLLSYGSKVSFTFEETALQELSGAHKHWRKTPVGAAIHAKVQIAEAKCEETLNLVREQLSDFDLEEIERDPRLRRDRDQVRHWQSIESRFHDAKNELSAWKLAVEQLFQK